MKYLKKYGAVFFAMCAVSSIAFSQKVGSTSMQFLKVIPSARGAALGDAYSVWASSADAVFWNPSGLALEQSQAFTFSYVNWIFDTRQGSFSYAASMGDFGVVGAQIQYVDYGEIEEAIWASPYIDPIENTGLTGNTFRPFSYLVGVSYAANLNDRFSTGLSVKYAHESLYNGKMVVAQISTGVNEKVKTWANGLLFDFGMRYNTGYHSIEIGASVQNFGSNMTYAKESNPVPLLFRWGIAGNLIGKDALIAHDDNNRIGLAFDLFQPNDYAQQEHVGIEFEYSEMFALRAGYKFNYDFEGLTMGGGVKQTLGAIKFSLDYSYSSIGTYLGNAHRISVGVRL